LLSRRGPPTAGAAPPGTISASALAISASISLSALDDLSHALAGEVLEIAGLENLHDAVPDVLGEPAVDPVLERGSEVVRRLIDVFGGGQDFLSRHFAVLAHCLQLVADAARRHPTAGVRAFGLRSAQDVVDQRKSRCEPLNGDALRSVGDGLQRGGDERPQCAQLLHDLRVAGRRYGFVGPRRTLPRGDLLDAKDFARLAHMAPT